jgi:hypothetical protein
MNVQRAVKGLVSGGACGALSRALLHRKKELLLPFRVPSSSCAACATDQRSLRACEVARAPVARLLRPNAGSSAS